MTWSMGTRPVGSTGNGYTCCKAEEKGGSDCKCTYGSIPL